MHSVSRPGLGSGTRIDLNADLGEESGTRVAYLKPHGALYNRVVDDEEQATAVLRGRRDGPGRSGALALRARGLDPGASTRPARCVRHWRRPGTTYARGH